VLTRLDVEVVDAGVSADPDAVARQAQQAVVDFIAVSTYNGVALDYLQALRREMEHVDLEVPIFIGGKLNQIPEDSPASLPVDITAELRALEAIVCHRVEDMLEELVKLAQERTA
jgi:methylmalonyl-CoA mutase cobalamin-binding subunit